MSELPPEATDDGIEEAAAPESQLESTSDYDMHAVSLANAAHDAGVNQAHETLKERIGNAYQIFQSDLDRLYREWQDAISTVRQQAGLNDSNGGTGNADQPDPANAR